MTAGSRSDGWIRVRRAWIAVAVCAAPLGAWAASALASVPAAGGSQVLFVAVLVAASVTVTVRAVRDPRSPSGVSDHTDRTQARGSVGWGLVAAGLWCWTVGEVVYRGWVRTWVPVPWPSVADVLLLGLYPLLAAGLVILARTRLGRTRWTVWADAGLVAASAAAWLWWGLFGLVGQAPMVEVAAVVTGAAYPVADLLLLSLLVGLLAAMGWPGDLSWLAVAAGVVAFWAGDTAYVANVAAGTAVSGVGLDAAWLVGACLIAVAGWVPTAGRTPTVSGTRAVAAPAAAFMAALLLLVIGARVYLPDGALLLAVAAIALGAWRAVAVMRGVAVRDAVRRVADTDPLTGLASRALFQRSADEALGTRGDSERVLVALADVAGFRQVNEAHGQAVGDAVLRQVGDRLRAGVRGVPSVVARLGGDEFAVLVGPVAMSDPAPHLAALGSALAGEYDVAGRRAPLRIPVAGAWAPVHGRDRSTLLRAADAALQRARRHDLSWTAYDPITDRIDTAAWTLIEDLRQGIPHGELVCYYQPKLDLRTGAVHSVETLVRWQHPTRGLLFPDTFIPVAEQSGLIRQVTVAVLGIAVAQAAAWRDDGLDVAVAVNLAMSDLLDLGLPDTVAGLLDAHGVPASRVILEITETEMMTDPDRAHRVAAALHAQGIPLSVDDYGQGYSSLAQLGHLSADEIKLDRAFVTGVAERPDLRSIVASTVSMAHDLGVRLVVEGVETGDDLDTVTALGCDLAQGYHISRPLPPDRATAWLIDHAGRADAPWASPVLTDP